MSLAQQTLDGSTVDLDVRAQERPSTLLHCEECGDFVLRSNRFDHEHDLLDLGGGFEPGLDRGPDNEDEENNDVTVPDKIGGYYEIELSYSVDYSFRVPAYDEHAAEERAKELKWDATPVDAYHVHTTRRKIDDITPEDMPEDWEPPLDGPLWEVFDG